MGGTFTVMFAVMPGTSFAPARTEMERVGETH